MADPHFADGSGQPRDDAMGAAGSVQAGAPFEPIGKEVAAVLMDLLPWALAVALHAAIILVSIFIVWQVGSAPLRPINSSDETAEVTLAPGGGGGGAARLADVPQHAGAATGLKDPALEPPSEVRAEPTAVTRQTVIGTRMTRATTPAAPPAFLINAQDSGKMFDRGPTLGHGPGSGGGSGGGSGSGIGSGRGAGRGPGSGAGDAGAMHYAFIIDDSGALIEGMPYVIDQLKTFVNDLTPDEEFAIFFFQGDKVKQVVDGQLRDVGEHQGYAAGTVFNKARALEALAQVRPEGTSNPARAIQIAFSDRHPPNIVYLLSQNITGSGQYELPRQVLLSAMATYNGPEGKLVRAPSGAAGGRPGGLMRMPPAVVNAIQYLHPDPLTSQGFAQATLQELVEQNNTRIAEYWKKYYPGETPPAGGRYRYIDAPTIFGTN